MPEMSKTWCLSNTCLLNDEWRPVLQVGQLPSVCLKQRKHLFLTASVNALVFYWSEEKFNFFMSHEAEKQAGT